MGAAVLKSLAGTERAEQLSEALLLSTEGALGW